MTGAPETEDRDEAEDWTEGGALHSADEARYQEEMLGHRIDAFLRQRGWKYSSDTPGCYLLWQREVNGKTIMVERSMALSLERNWPPAPAGEEPSLAEPAPGLWQAEWQCGSCGSCIRHGRPHHRALAPVRPAPRVLRCGAYYYGHPRGRCGWRMSFVWIWVPPGGRGS
jgi:hypothetical protein